MATNPTIMTLSGFYEKYGQKVFEAFKRQKNGKYNAFNKIILKDDSYEVQQIIKNSVNNLSKNVEKLNMFSTNLSKQLNLSNVLSSVSAITGVLNLCATVAGFVIIHKDLENVQQKLNSLAKTILDAHDQETIYKFDKVLGIYENMLDCKKIGNEFSESKYFELINEEQAILKLLIKVFNKSTSNCKNDILTTIIALSSMLSCTISNFDEIYFFEHGNIQKFHSSHSSWEEIYDILLSKSFENDLYDFMFIDENRNQFESDILVDTIRNSFREALQSIKDKQTIIELNESREDLNNLTKLINQSVLDDIDESLEEMGLSENVQVQSLVKEATQTLGMS